MKALLKLAVTSKKHMMLFVATFLSLIFLSIASQLEVFALGILSNKGVDVFQLFSEKTGSVENDKVSLEGINRRFYDIDVDHKGYFTKQEASTYLVSSKKDINPLNWVIHSAKQYVFKTDGVGPILFMLVAVAIFKAIWLFFSRYMTQLLAIRTSRDLRQMYFEHIQSLPMSFYQKYDLGSLSSRVVGDAGQISASINSFLTNYLQTPFTLISCLSMCFYLSWQLSLVVFLGVPLIVIPITILARRVKAVSRQLQSNQERFASLIIDFLSGIQTIKTFAMEAFSIQKYKEQNSRTAVLEGKIAKYGLMVRPILHAVTTLCLASIVVFGLYILGISLSQLIVFCALLQLVYEPVKKFADENTNIQKGVVAAERMFEVLNQKNPIPDHPEAALFQRFDDEIRFENVSFSYHSKPVLKNVSFSIKKGQTVAVVGPTGSGKSTLVQLLPRLYSPDSGSIFIDGAKIEDFTLNSLRENMAFVAQKPFLFNDTVEANIAYGRQFSEEAIHTAARLAHADEFIKELSDGYKTKLSEAGKNLSGGQQQRLAIARALVKQAPILILDEATSALDAVSEDKIKQALRSLHGQVTQIIIAHRFSTIEHADLILYLENGQLVAQGTKDELLVTCPGFSSMWQLQYRQADDSVLSSVSV
jgi:ABC-type multidrug transport system fused ATPase/permease subunit